MNTRYLGGLYMALAASIWGGMYVVSKIILATVQPMELVWLRYVVALITLAVCIVATKQSWKISWRHVPLVVAVGVIGYLVSIWTQFLGTKLSTAQMGAMITSATPAFMVVFGRLLLKEKVTLRRAFSVGLATIGVLMIVGIGGISHSYQLGGMILFVAAITWALMSVLVKRIPNDYSQLTVTLYATFVATLLITPIAVGQLVHTTASTWQQSGMWGGILYLGVVSTAGAFFLWNKGLQMVDASSGGLFFFFQPLVGTFLGWLLLGEVVGVSFWLGAALIVISVSLVVLDS
ncbi:DMT family transporter [Alicyclobacillus fastidiosus]|uniref:DMT family transporter n=1 Tax=Alicyclobacillus fastidiosus TaxID=392011 RepID=A0ABY6ZGM5_9BACL|nr:DMT family transporter [Alicyclobacillus fastidiosus]WAH41997.1 DMT family transporter [Alicyclobacillus fastidiosus]GMA63734.1 membrane protein [Alicyclobacillus fastidiosus]